MQLDKHVQRQDDDQDPPTQSGYHQALATKVEPAADEEAG